LLSASALRDGSGGSSPTTSSGLVWNLDKYDGFRFE
jgi:hypothetical protein